MKKFLICLSILFSFCFIGSVKAATLNGKVIDQAFFDDLWSRSGGLTSLGYQKENYPYVACKQMTSSYFACVFLQTTAFNPNNIGPSWTPSPNYSKLSIKYVVSTDTMTLQNFNFFIQNSDTSVQSFDLYNYQNNLVKNKNVDYNVSNDFIVNFHLNGGEVMDFSNILNPNHITLDYQIETTTEELVDYLHSITPIRANYTFIGWYYDENFTQLYDSSNTLNSDIDLYAKWQYNPIITLHLNGGNVEDNFTNYKEINNIKEEMCALANCTQYNSWATNPYKNLIKDIESGRNTVNGFLSNYNTSNNDEFRNLANELFNLYQTNGTKYVDDYSIRINYNEVNDYIRYIGNNIEKLGMIFRGFYYDSNFTNPRGFNDNITEDRDIYAKWIYDNVDDFLSNTNFTTYTFNTNYDYAVITPYNSLDDVYLGINTLNRDITLYTYMYLYDNYTNEAYSLEPLYSKNNIYYYLLNTIHIDNTIEVLLLPKTVFENNNYDFLLTDNAYITYTNDLTEAVIYDNEGNQIETDISESYQTFQNNLINDETDLLMIFKNLINNKDNRVFSNINTMWNQIKKTKLYPYFMILIVGSLIILIIKAARRN